MKHIVYSVILFWSWFFSGVGMLVRRRAAEMVEKCSHVSV